MTILLLYMMMKMMMLIMMMIKVGDLSVYSGFMASQQ